MKEKLLRKLSGKIDAAKLSKAIQIIESGRAKYSSQNSSEGNRLHIEDIAAELGVQPIHKGGHFIFIHNEWIGYPFGAKQIEIL